LKKRLVKFIDLLKTKKNDIEDFKRSIQDLRVVKQMYGKK